MLVLSAPLAAAARERKMASSTHHGIDVSTAVHEAQDARTSDGPQGIGPIVREVAQDHGVPPPPDFKDGVITVVSADGATHEFTTFSDALASAAAGDTLQVGAGIYKEAIDLTVPVHIVGESGAILDGSGFKADAGTQATVELFGGFSGGSISGLDIQAVAGGGAVQSIYGEDLNGLTLSGDTFDAGTNTAGSLVYLNPNTTTVTLDGNTFIGSSLADSPLLGIEADNVQVTHNTFGDTVGTYPSVEIFDGANGTTTDVQLVGNTGLDPTEVLYSA